MNTKRAEDLKAERTHKMPEELKDTFLAIYNRIAPKIRIDGLTAKVENEPDASPEIEITSNDERLYIILSFYSKTGSEDVNSYHWEYMDCMTGAIIESELDHTASDEEVISFFEHTLTTDESVMKL
jgi:hypothetical protein